MLLFVCGGGDGGVVTAVAEMVFLLFNIHSEP
jgi:hypothetical protein